MSVNNTGFLNNEPAVLIETELSNFVANIVGFVGFGVNLALYLATAHALIKYRKRQYHWRIFFTLITVIMILNFYKLIVYSKFQIDSYIYLRDMPGGPLAATIKTIVPSKWFEAEFHLAMIEVFLQDGLYVYRYYLFIGPVFWMLAPVYALYLASIVLTILYQVQWAYPGSVIRSQSSTTLAYPLWSVTILLNLIITIVIVIKIQRQRRHIRDAMGQQYADDLGGISTMLIESAALYTIPALAFLITLGINTPWVNLTNAFINPAQAIATLLIVYRVATGRAWTRSLASTGMPDGVSYCPECSHMRGSGSNGSGSLVRVPSGGRTPIFKSNGRKNGTDVYVHSQTTVKTDQPHEHHVANDKAKSSSSAAPSVTDVDTESLHH